MQTRPGAAPGDDGGKPAAHGPLLVLRWSSRATLVLRGSRAREPAASKKSLRFRGYVCVRSPSRRQDANTVRLHDRDFARPTVGGACALAPRLPQVPRGGRRPLARSLALSLAHTRAHTDGVTEGAHRASARAGKSDAASGDPHCAPGVSDAPAAPSGLSCATSGGGSPRASAMEAQVATMCRYSASSCGTSAIVRDAGSRRRKR